MVSKISKPKKCLITEDNKRAPWDKETMASDYKEDQAKKEKRKWKANKTKYGKTYSPTHSTAAVNFHQQQEEDVFTRLYNNHTAQISKQLQLVTQRFLIRQRRLVVSNTSDAKLNVSYSLGNNYIHNFITKNKELLKNWRGWNTTCFIFGRKLLNSLIHVKFTDEL